MQPIDEITRIERKLHAAKGLLRELKQNRWIDLNYKDKKASPYEQQIQQTEIEIVEHRRKLRSLYETI